MKPELCGAQAIGFSKAFFTYFRSRQSRTVIDRGVAPIGLRRPALRAVGQLVGALCLAAVGATHPAHAEPKAKPLTCSQLKDNIRQIIERDSRGVQKVVNVNLSDGSFEKDGLLNCYADVTTNRGMVLGSYWVFNQKDGSLVRKWEPFWPE